MDKLEDLKIELAWLRLTYETAQENMRDLVSDIEFLEDQIKELENPQ